MTTTFSPLPRRSAHPTPIALLIGAIAAALGTAGVVSLGDGDGDRGGGSAPLSPRGTVEAFLATAFSGDHATHWDLLCREEQRAVGPRGQYIEQLATTAKASDRDDLFHGDVRGVRAAEPPHEDGFVVEVLFSSADGPAFVEEVLVIREDGGLRVCGQP